MHLLPILLFKPDETVVLIVKITTVICSIQAHNNYQIARCEPGPTKTAYNFKNDHIIEVCI